MTTSTIFKDACKCWRAFWSACFSMLQEAKPTCRLSLTSNSMINHWQAAFKYNTDSWLLCSVPREITLAIPTNHNLFTQKFAYQQSPFPFPPFTYRKEVKPLHPLEGGVCYEYQGWVVRKPVNVNPGLKVDRIINFSYIKIIFASYFSNSKISLKGCKYSL